MPHDQSTANREITHTRVFDAPRELVYRAWTDPKHLAVWWGPNGFTNTIHEMSVKPGGVLRFIMHGPDGTDYPSKIVYLEVVPNQRLVYDLGTDDDKWEHFHVVVTFEEVGTKTRLTMRGIWPTPEACEAVKKFGAVEGGRQTLERLATYLPGIR